MAVIVGPAGDGVTVTGTADDDEIHVAAGNQTIDGGGGIDQIDFAAVVGTSITGVVPNGVGMNVDLEAGTAVVTNYTVEPAPVYGQLNTYHYTLANVENVVGAYSPDILKAALSGSTLNGLGGNDTLIGNVGDDMLIGGAGADTLYGYDGADVLIGGGGADALFGGTGADIFRYESGTASTNSELDIIQDFLTGFDSIDLTALTPSNVSILYYNGGSIISGGSGATAFQIGSVRYVNASDLTGLVHGVYVVGDGDPNVLTGSALDDSLVGGAGNDIIIGGGAGDALYGGAGADTFKYLSASDSTSSVLDIIHDFQTGIDKIDLTALNPTNVSILRYNGGTFISGVATGGPTFQIASTQDVNASDLIGLTGAVYMAGDAGDNVLIGGPGNSTEWRGLGNDTLDGGAGNDTLIGGGGVDSLYGGAGADTFKYLSVSDSPGSGDGIGDFETGVDKIDLSALNLTKLSFTREFGGAFVIGVTSDGAEIRVHTDSPYEGINAPDVIGWAGPVSMTGSAGSDTLIGGAFNDAIGGGAGTDRIIGGGGADVLSGTGIAIVEPTPDINTFVYLAASDSTAAAPDRIIDFRTDLDKIDLRAVHTSAGDTVNFLSDATATYLFVQHAGEATADMVILLNTPTFKVSDILW